MLKLVLWLIPLFGISFFPLSALPRSPYVDPSQGAAINEMRDLVDSLHHMVKNQELEIKSFEQQFENLNTILEALRDQMHDNGSTQKEMLRVNSQTMEMKIAALESASKGLAADIKQLQNHANETTTALQTFKQKLAEIDQKISSNSKNTEALQSAVQSVVEAFQVKAELTTSPSLSGWTGKTYKVQSGDTLEKIAKANQTTIQALKDLNGITNDKIVVGKTLKIPG